jgi:ABC-type antimicrobial peptide transport system permease subunit
VLERFREIATMKCLGAMDGFIGSLFVMEAAILGGVGGLIGVTGGLIIGVGRMTWIFGTAALDSLPWTEILICGILASLTGVLVTCLAAAYPAFRAAALTPMAAMRVV